MWKIQTPLDASVLAMKISGLIYAFVGFIVLFIGLLLGTGVDFAGVSSLLSYLPITAGQIGALAVLFAALLLLNTVFLWWTAKAMRTGSKWARISALINGLLLLTTLPPFGTLLGGVILYGLIQPPPTAPAPAPAPHSPHTG
jgi:hypothetical protein